MDLFDIWIKHPKENRHEEMFRLVSLRHDLSSATKHSLRDIKSVISSISAKFSQKWGSSNRIRERFLEINEEWLKGADIVFTVSLMQQQPQPSTSTESLPGPYSVLGGQKFQKFQALAENTRKHYLDLYTWYNMPVTVHKIFRHSAVIIKSALLPIGQLSEEAQEARNKDCRRFREHNTCKRSRITTNRDLLNMLIITSDPVISSMREVPKKQIGKMSCRQMKKLLGGNTLPPPADESDEDYEPLYTKSSPSKFKYQGLVLSSDSESEHDESNESIEMESPEPEKTRKKKKKKKKQNKVKHQTPEINYDPEMDEIDRSLMEVNAMLGAPPPSPALAAPLAVQANVMAVQIKHLNYSNELRRLFGPEEEDERNRRRARVPSLLLKKWVIVPMGENNVVNYRKYGLSMSVNRVEKGCTYFTFDHGVEYQKVHRAFLRYVGNTRASLVFPPDEARRSLHVDALLQTADTMFRMEDYTGANSLIEQAIAFMQSTFHPSFNLADNNVRLEFKFLENRPFHVGILKFLHLLTNRACHRTALELAKLLLNLDPSDPLGVLIVIDVLALRAREHAWLIDAIDHWTKERDAGFLFNMQYSYAMAHFHVTKKAKGDMTHADELLHKAILRFPLVAVKILENCNVKMSDKAKSSALFNSVADSATTHLKDLINLYAKFVWSKWREPPVMEWFSRNVNALAERYEEDTGLQEQVKVWTNERLNLFQGWPEQITRHLMVIKPMSSLLVDGAVPYPGKPNDITCDPSPPGDTVNRYGYQYRASSPSAPANNYSAFVQLFQSLMPHYNIIVTGDYDEDDDEDVEDDEDEIAEMQGLDPEAAREADQIRQMQLAANLGIDYDNMFGPDDVGGVPDLDGDEFELQLGADEPGGPANLIISIGDLTNAVRRFMTTYETGNDPGEGPENPPPDRQNGDPQAILSLYLRNVLCLHENAATVIYHIFIMMCYTMPLAGAILADNFLGRYRVILYFSVIYFVGATLVCFSSIPPLMLPPTTTSMLGLILIATGTGGIKPCVAAFGGDQFRLPNENHLLQRFFSNFYCTVNLGGFMGMVVTPALRRSVMCFGDDTCYALGFGFPALLVLVSIVIFVAGKPWYRIKEPRDNVTLKFVSCAWYAFKKHLTHSAKDPPCEHWLDHAVPKYGPKLVADMKVVCSILYMYLPIPIFWSLFDQQGSRWTFQASRLRSEVFGVSLMPDQLQVMNPAMVLVMIPVCPGGAWPILPELPPLYKMFVGGVLAAMAFAAAGILQISIERSTLQVPRPHQTGLVFMNTLGCAVEVSVWGEGMAVVEAHATALMTPLPLRAHTVSARCPADCSGRVMPVHAVQHNRLEPVGGMFLPIIIGQNSDDHLMFYFMDPNPFIKSLTGKPKLKVVYIGDTGPNKNVSITIETAKSLSDIYYVSNAPVDHIGESAYMCLQPGSFMWRAQSSDAELAGAGEGLVRTGGVYVLCLRERLGRLDAAVLHSPNPPNELNLAWIVPQYLLISISEIMFAVSGLEFSFTQAPKSMKTITIAAWYVSVAFGNLIVILVAQAKIFESRAMEFFGYAGMLALAMAVFLHMVRNFQPRNVDTDMSSSESHPLLRSRVISVHSLFTSSAQGRGASSRSSSLASSWLRLAERAPPAAWPARAHVNLATPSSGAMHVTTLAKD